MTIQTKNGLKLFKAGDKVLYNGEYILVDRQGQNKQVGFEITIEEGEQFPPSPDEELFYAFSDSCLDEPCEVIGEPVEEN